MLGYGNTNDIGDTEHPSTAGVVDLGPGVRAVSVAAGAGHTCALADDSAVRCWGQGYGGRLGYANTLSIGDDEKPAAAGPVQLGRRVRSITAGDYHTCAILDDWTVRCWGVGFTYFGSGHLGYGNTMQIGDDETPGSVGPVDLGAGRTARAITAGANHVRAILDTGQVRCWGSYFFGQLGVPVQQNIGDNETPGSIAPVDLGPGRTATAISAGSYHTCVILDDGSVRCWGSGPDGPVDLGPGARGIAIDAGSEHTCAVLDDGTAVLLGRGAQRQAGLREPQRHRRRRGTGQRRTGRPGSRSPSDGDHRRERPHLRRPRRRTDPLLGYPRVGRPRAVRPSVADRRRRDAGPVPPGEPRRDDLRRTRCPPRCRRRVGRAWPRLTHLDRADPGSAPISQYRITWARPGEIKHTQRATTTEPGAFLSGLYPGVYRFTVVASNASAQRAGGDLQRGAASRTPSHRLRTCNYRRNADGNTSA